MTSNNNNFLNTTDTLFEDMPSESHSAELTGSPMLMERMERTSTYPTKQLPTEMNDPAGPINRGLNRNHSTWDAFEQASPYGDYPIISPMYRNNHAYAPQSVRSSQITGMHDQFGLWRSASNAFVGNASARHAAAQYLNINGPGNTMNPSPGSQDPPGFPPLDSDGLQHDRPDVTKRTDGYDTPNIKPIPGFDNANPVPYWAAPGGMTPNAYHMQDWSDSVINTPWSQRMNPFQPNGYYPIPSPMGMNSGGPIAFPSPFMRNDNMVYPSSVANVDRHHEDAPTEDIPALPSPVANDDLNHFSPWRNLNSLPDCRPLPKNESSDSHHIAENTLRAAGYDSLASEGITGDYPFTPPPHGDERGLMSVRNSSNAVVDGVSKSLGSLNHPHDCRPCAFYWTKGCINGQDCRFCHEWHPPKKKKPMKEQKNLMIIARPDGKIEFMRCTVNEAMRVL